MLSRPTPVRLPNPTRVHAPSAPTSADSEATRRDATSAQTYAIELALLEPARSATVRGSYAEALGAIARHQREFPNGQLAEERSALRVRALWGLGRTAEAEAAAASFRQSYPRSALLAWMRPRSASPR
jgi:TolA-binding protein